MTHKKKNGLKPKRQDGKGLTDGTSAKSQLNMVETEGPQLASHLGGTSSCPQPTDIEQIDEMVKLQGSSVVAELENTLRNGDMNINEDRTNVPSVAANAEIRLAHTP